MKISIVFFLVGIFAMPSHCWETAEFEMFDLVEEVGENFYDVLGIKQVILHYLFHEAMPIFLYAVVMSYLTFLHKILSFIDRGNYASILANLMALTRFSLAVLNSANACPVV